jgi:hypothetical protein
VKVLHEVKAVWGQQVQIQAQSAVDYLPGQVALENTTANVVFSWAFLNLKNSTYLKCRKVLCSESVRVESWLFGQAVHHVSKGKIEATKKRRTKLQD